MFGDGRVRGERGPSGAGTRKARSRWSFRVAAAVFGFVLFGAGIAIADLPDGNAINGCRSSTSGALRVIDKSAGQTCNTGETALSWTTWRWRGAWLSTTAYNVGDVVSFRGATALAVVRPPTGIRPTNRIYWTVFAASWIWRGPWISTATYRSGDVVSYNGSTYLALVGPPVATIPNNAAYWSFIALHGAAGAKGATGLAGQTGPQGASGAVGPQGIAGAVGATGTQGVEGATGAQGVQGVTGAQGVQGVTGAIGAQGVTGAIGAIGAIGATGALGPEGPQGSTGPQGIQGVTGAQGAQGVTGAIGVTGPRGLQGATGAQGVEGVTGAQGAQGVQGVTGAQGTQGLQGATGAIGATGPQGLQGVTGTQGVTGSQGVAGATGAAGSAAPGGGIISGGSNGVVVADGQFLGPFSAAPDATLGHVEFPVKTAGTLSDFQVKVQLAASASGSVIFTVYKNGTPTSATCTITGLTATTCSDSTHTVAFNPGDTLAVAITKTSLPTFSITGWIAQYG